MPQPPRTPLPPSVAPSLRRSVAEFPSVPACLRAIVPFFFLPPLALAGPYSPVAGLAGSDAIPITDPRIVAWASEVNAFARGPLDIANPTGPLASFGAPSASLGPAQGTVFDVVSLGDGGSITLTFPIPIYNSRGPDIAVFENGFKAGTSDFLFAELARVAVSSDGINFVEFPPVSLTPADVADDQLSSFDTIDSSDVRNLAGKQPVGFGTPFDLAELLPHPLLDPARIRFVRITDVVGRITPTGSYLPSLDSLGYPINDPYPTPFNTGGFDLDAVAVLNGFLVIPEPAAMVGLVASFALLTRVRRD
jgi:hypothetical protein